MENTLNNIKSADVYFGSGKSDYLFSSNKDKKQELLDKFSQTRLSLFVEINELTLLSIKDPVERKRLQAEMIARRINKMPLGYSFDPKKEMIQGYWELGNCDNFKDGSLKTFLENMNNKHRGGLPGKKKLVWNSR